MEMEFDDDMNEFEWNTRDEESIGLRANTHLETMTWLGLEIIGMTFPSQLHIPSVEDVEQGCDVNAHFQDFLKEWKTATMASFNFLSCTCMVYWSNYVVYVRPCLQQHREPLQNMSQKMYDANPEHYGNEELHPYGNQIFGGLPEVYEVNETLLNKLFNLDDDND